MKIFRAEHTADSLKDQQVQFELRIYDGPLSEATRYVLTDYTLEEALPHAEILSEENQKLWALAVCPLELQECLIWISGTDYHMNPGRSRQFWRKRAHMQYRYLEAASMRGEQPRLPNGLRRIRMFPEWTGGLSLWESLSENYPYEPDVLPASRELVADLIEWNLEWESYGCNAERPDAWKEAGWHLFKRLSDELADYAEIVPEFDDRTP